MVRMLVGRAEHLLRFGGERRHALATARASADQDQTANQMQLGQCQFLRDHAAQREPQHINLGKTERLDAGSGVGGHCLDGGRYVARTAGNSRIVEQDDFAVPGEAICHHRVPMIHGAGEMHGED